MLFSTPTFYAVSKFALSYKGDGNLRTRLSSCLAFRKGRSLKKLRDSIGFRALNKNKFKCGQIF